MCLSRHMSSQKFQCDEKCKECCVVFSWFALVSVPADVQQGLVRQGPYGSSADQLLFSFSIIFFF